MKQLALFLTLILITFNIFALELSIEKAKELALQNNNSLLSAREAFNISTISKKRAYLNLIPSGNLSGNVSSSEPKPMMMGVDSSDLEDVNISVNASLSQPIFNGGKIWLGAKIQTDTEKITENQFKQTKISLLNEIESKYFQCLKLASQKENAELDLKASQKQSKISKLKFENNLISKADYLKSQTAESNKNIALIQLQNAYNISILDLQNSIGIFQDINLQKINSAKITIEAKKYLSIISNDKISNELFKIGIEENPTYRISKISQNINKKSLLMSYGNFLPTLNLSYSKNWNETIDPDNNYDESSTIALSTSFPIFPIIDNVLGVSEKKHNLKKSEYELKSMESNLNLGIKSALQNLILSAQTIKSTKLSKDLATETYKQMEERYKNNLVSLTDLMDTQVMYFNSLNQHSNSIYSFLEAKNNLKFQVGLENFNKIENIIFNKREKK